MKTIHETCKVPGLFLALLLVGCATGKRQGTAPQGEFSRLYAEGSPQAIELGRQASSLEETRRRTTHRIALVRSQIGTQGDEDKLDDLEDELEVLAYLDAWLSGPSASEKETLSRNVQAQRILDILENEDADSDAAHNFPAALKGMVSTSLGGHCIPGPGKGGVLGESAAKESSFLHDPARGAFLTKADLAGMTPEQVSSLDVSPAHPAWHPRAARPRDPVAAQRAAMEAGVNGTLREKGDLPAGRTWDIGSSRKVLFMNEVYKSATSAKAEVEDAYGVEWKIKWGDEVQSEPVSTRLYLLAGGKMTDFVVAGGPEGMMMVLAKEGEYTNEGKEAKSAREPATVAQLAESLDDFYGFDIHPYIQSHGVIDAGNVSRVLANLPEGGKRKYRAKELIGRTWVAFREFSLELRPKGYIRTLTGPAFSDLGAREDRAARGLYVFALWLAARDSKDDNSKTYFLKKPASGRGSDMRIASHAEGLHDLGVTLGAVGAAGTLNAMKTGGDFLWESPSRRWIRSRQTFVYMPEAFTSTTWSDARWMAMRIAAISDAEIRAAVASSRWPDFMQETLAYKLQARRNRIAEVFGVGQPGIVSPPHIAVDLGSPEKIRTAEQRYGLSPGSLAKELGSRSGTEVLVRAGEIVNSSESALITQLTIQRHPAGLSDRYRRLLNRPPKALRR